MKIITYIFSQMPPNKKVVFIHSFMKAVRSMRYATDCEIYQEEDGQFIRTKNKTLTFGYNGSDEHPHVIHTQQELNAALMKEFEYAFTIFIEYYSHEYDSQVEQTIAIS